MPTTRRADSVRPQSLKRIERSLVSLFLILVFGAIACDRPPSIDEIRVLQDQGRYAATIEPLRARIEAHPEDAEAHLLYGIALGRTGASRVAVWSLRKAAEAPEFRIDANLELATTAGNSGNWQQAIEAADLVIELDPENISAHLIRGEAILGEGKDPDRALEDFEFILDLDAANVPALSSRAAALLMAGRADEASEALEELDAVVAENAPKDSKILARLCATQAVLRAERGEVADAEARFAACLEEFPGQAVVVQPALTFFDQIGKTGRADEILENALELAPESQSYRRMLASRAAARGDVVAAEVILRSGVEFEDPELRAAAWTDLTNFYLERDDLPAAIETYEQALALSEDPPQLAILSHADLLARDGQHERALEVAGQLENDDYRGLIEARIHLNEGRPAKALARLDEILPNWPNNAGARYYAARAAEQLGDFTRAIEEYRQSLRSAPNQTEAALRMAKLYFAAGAFQNAWNSGGQYLRAHPTDPEGVWVMVRASATGDPANLRGLFNQLSKTPLWPVALAARADVLGESLGAEAALEWIQGAKGLDLTQASNVDVLRAKVKHSLAAGDRGEAERAMQAALDADPGFSAFHEIHGRVLEASATPIEEVRAAYQRATELDSKNAHALEALGRLAENEGAVDDALVLYDRATAAHPEDPGSARRAAALARAAGRTEEAEGRWEELLLEHPWDAAAAQQLAQMRLDRGQADDSIVALAERAVLFRGGPEAQQLLVRVHEARGEKKRAAEVSRAIESGERIATQKVTPVGGV
jgi:tetratricopeptide (TPR) repeat protein